MEPRPISLEQKELSDYEGPAPQPFQVVGPLPAPSDSDVASLITDPESSTREAIATSYAPRLLSIEGARMGIDDISTMRPGARTMTTWETPDATGVVVHPSVVYVPEGFAGYHWWAAITPYFASNNQIENPCVLVSTDGITWVSAPGVTNPLTPAPAGGYNSDPCLLLGPDRVWYLFYRAYDGSTPKENIALFTSTDGQTWEGPTTVLTTDESVARFVSPSVWFDPSTGVWHMLAVDILPSSKPITHFTSSSPTGPWANQGTLSISPPLTDSHKPWHLEARWVSGQIIALIQSSTADGISGRLYYGTVNRENTAITVQENPTIPGSAYRSTFVPSFTERGLSLDTFIGLNATGNQWWVERAPVRYDPNDAISTHNNQLAKAILLEPGYLFADSFTRTGETLGTSDTGHLWTSSAGTWKTNGSQAYLDSSSNARSTVELGVANATVKMLFSGMEVNQNWLVLRYSDSSNFIRIGSSNGTMYFQTIEAGAIGTQITIGSTISGTREFSVRMNGDNFYIHIDGLLVGEITNSFNNDATKIGINAQNTNTRVMSIFATS